MEIYFHGLFVLTLVCSGYIIKRYEKKEVFVCGISNNYIKAACDNVLLYGHGLFLCKKENS